MSYLVTALGFAEHEKLALPRNLLGATLHLWRLVLTIGEAVLDFGSAVPVPMLGTACRGTRVNSAIHYLDTGLVAPNVRSILVTFLLDIMATTGLLVIDKLHA